MSRRKLHISKDLALPLDVAGEAMAILATRGAGKSYTSADLVEELWDAKIQFCVLDPTGVYWGLRAAANGKDPGLPVYVLGGVHADAPLEHTAGKLIADVLVDTGQSLVLDLSDFTKGEQTHFVSEFADRLYNRKARDRQTLHLVMDEADEFAPQKAIGREEPVMLGRMTRLVGKGRSRGIGVTLITQRSATLNKNVLDLVDTLVAMRIGSPRDRKAVQGWVDYKQLDDELGVVGSLPGLQTGTAWVWSAVRDILQLVTMRRIRTFDSYATPKPGQVIREPKGLAPLDVAKLGEQIEATKERAKAADPKELTKALRESRAETAKLRKSLEARPQTTAEPERVEVRVLDEDALLALKKAGTSLEELEARAQEIVKACADGLGKIAGAGAAVASSIEELIARSRSLLAEGTPRRTSSGSSGRSGPPSVPSPRRGTGSPAGASPPASGASPRPSTGGIGASEQRILDALAWLESVGLAPAETAQVAWLAGYKPSGGRFNNLKGGLRTRGLIDYPRAGTIGLTEEGRALSDAPASPVSTEELQERILQNLPASEARVLQAVIPHYGGSLSRQEVAEATGYDASGGRFNNLLGRLRGLGLIEYPAQGFVAPAPVLFLEER